MVCIENNSIQREECSARSSSDSIRVFNRLSDGLLNAVAYTEPDTVTTADDWMPATVRVPALAVIDPSATMDVLQ